MNANNTSAAQRSSTTCQGITQKPPYPLESNYTFDDCNQTEKFVYGADKNTTLSTKTHEQ